MLREMIRRIIHENKLISHLLFTSQRLERMRVYYPLRIQYHHFRTQNTLNIEQEKYSRSKYAIGPIPRPKTEKTQFLPPRLKLHTPLTAVEWTEMKQKTIKNKEITDTAFHSYVMGLCIAEKNFIAAKSYMDFLKLENITPDIKTLARYMRLCAGCIDYAGEDLILRLYSLIKMDTEEIGLDSTTTEHIICGLSQTNLWRECLTMIDSLRSSHKPSREAYNFLAASAFRNNDSAIAMKLLFQMIIDKRIPSGYVFNHWLNFCRNTAKYDENVATTLLKQCLDYCRETCISLPTDIAEEVKYQWQRNLTVNKKPEGWKGEFTTIANTGLCNLCNKKLEVIEFTSTEFEELRDVVMSKIIEGEDGKLKTIPEEMVALKEFMYKTAPYDIVLDAQTIVAGFKTNQARAIQLRNVIAHLVKVKQKKVLLLCKKRMTTWRRDEMIEISNMTCCFITQDVTDEDFLILYAAMFSGLGTLIVTKESMEDHKRLLKNDHYAMMFDLWLRRHQILFRSRPTGEISVQMPVHFNPVTQRTKDNIHIACTNNVGPAVIKEVPATWLCLSREGAAKMEVLKYPRM